MLCLTRIRGITCSAFTQHGKVMGCLAVVSQFPDAQACMSMLGIGLDARTRWFNA